MRRPALTLSAAFGVVAVLALAQPAAAQTASGNGAKATDCASPGAPAMAGAPSPAPAPAETGSTARPGSGATPPSGTGASETLDGTASSQAWNESHGSTAMLDCVETLNGQ